MFGIVIYSIIFCIYINEAIAFKIIMTILLSYFNHLGENLISNTLNICIVVQTSNVIKPIYQYLSK